MQRRTSDKGLTPSGFGAGNYETLYPGDQISAKVEVDSSFPRESYTIEWRWVNRPKLASENHVQLTIGDEHIGARFKLQVIVKSTANWHRFSDCDDHVSLSYRVLPLKE